MRANGLSIDTNRRGVPGRGRVFLVLGLMAGSLAAAGPVSASAGTLLKGPYDVAGIYKGEINGEFDLGSFLLELERQGKSRIRDQVTLSAQGTVKNPRNKESHAFAISSRFQVMRDLVQLQGVEYRKDGAAYQIAEKDRDEEEVLRSVLPFMYLIERTVRESGSPSATPAGGTRYTVVPDQGGSANYLYLRWTPAGAGRWTAAVVAQETDTSTGADVAREICRFEITLDPDGAAHLESCRIIVIDRPSKYLEVVLNRR